ncbi:antibiotic biosynthesis monooxygenase family protein [Micromonosporaceae bacterium Da 78-11]
MSEPKQSTIVAGADLITVINVFTCPEVRQNELVAALDRATTEIFEHVDGFISANLHASLDRTRVVNYAQWRSADHFDAAHRNPDVQRHLDDIMVIAESADPRLFTVRAVHHA